MIGGEDRISSKSQLTGFLTSYLQENNYDLPPSPEILCNTNGRINCHEKELEVELIIMHVCFILQVHEVSEPVPALFYILLIHFY
jgi:hypothetical protein